MHGRMHPNYCQITILLVVDLCSSLAYFMMTQPLPIAGKLPIKTLVAKQLPTNVHTPLTWIDVCAHACTSSSSLVQLTCTIVWNILINSTSSLVLQLVTCIWGKYL